MSVADLFPGGKRFTTLADVIGSIESDDHPARLRFEPALYARIAAGYLAPQYSALVRAIQIANVCSAQTACMIAATSWGEFQILGENIYAPVCAWRGTVFDFLASIEVQRLSFKRFAIARGIDYELAAIDDGVARKIAAVYNGPGNVDDYAGRIMQRVRANV